MQSGLSHPKQWLHARGSLPSPVSRLYFIFRLFTRISNSRSANRKMTDIYSLHAKRPITSEKPVHL
jgi:hypothetical protein